MLHGYRQEVAVDTKSKIEHRLLVDGEEKTLTAATVSIYLGTSAIATGLATTQAGSIATLEQTWASSTYTRGETYRAVWSLTHAGGTEEREQYFDVVRRLFQSQLGSTDISEYDPSASAQAPQGFVKFMHIAWKTILRAIRQRYSHELQKGNGIISASPGDAFFPEDFFDAHLVLTLKEFYFVNSFDAGPASEDWGKYLEYKERGENLLDEALSRFDLDMDGDKRLDDEERNLSASFRFRR